MNWTRHLENWGNCQRCMLSERRTQVVLARGTLPCDVLFCGEAPGKGEDTIGQPFVGEAGAKILDPILQRAFMGYPQISMAFTNIIACIPKDKDGNILMGNKIPIRCIRECSPRLEEFVGICKPRAIVWIGGLAAKHGPSVEFEAIRQIKIIHPASILRSNVVTREEEGRKCIACIRSLLFDLKGEMDEQCPF